MQIYCNPSLNSTDNYSCFSHTGLSSYYVRASQKTKILEALLDNSKVFENSRSLMNTHALLSTLSLSNHEIPEFTLRDLLPVIEESFGKHSLESIYATLGSFSLSHSDAKVLFFGI